MGTLASFTPYTGDEPFLTGVPKEKLALYPIELAFANQTINTDSAEITVMLQNQGSDTISIEEIVLVGPFEDASAPLAELEAGQIAELKVVFHPLMAGPVTGGLHIKAPNAIGDKFVKLTGTGVLAPSLAPEFYQLIGLNNEAYSAVNVDAGVYGLVATGTFDGAAIQLQWRAESTDPWANLGGALVNAADPSIYGIPLTSCQVRAVISGGGAGTNLNAQLVW